MCQEALDLERSNGGERTESKCRKDKDLWYRPGPPAEFKWVPMCRLSHCSGQQQHLLQQLQALSAQERQWAQGLYKRPWLQMYTVPNLQRLQGTDRAMIRQICNVRPQDIVTTRSNELLAWLGIEDLDLILKERRLQWYGHVEHSNGAVKTAFDIQVDGKHGPGRPKVTWKQLTERDCREWKLSAIDPHDIPGDLVWDLRCVQQASYLEGGHWCGCCPCTCTLIKNLMMMMGQGQVIHNFRYYTWL